MLPNVLTHKDKTNKILKAWIENNNFTIIKYDGKARGNRAEIIVLNYEVRIWPQSYFPGFTGSG